VQLLAPLAPHLAEELWSRLGERFSIHESTWPAPDQSILDSRQRTIVVQLDGRVRTRIEVAGDATEQQVVRAAIDATGTRPSRVVYVPGKLVSLVTK
jgi:leucyl-tRNA synthetase